MGGTYGNYHKNFSEITLQICHKTDCVQSGTMTFHKKQKKLPHKTKQAKQRVYKCLPQGQGGNSIHSESLFTDYVSPKNRQARNQWQNCRIGKPSAKKWVFLPDHVGLGPEVKEKLGEIRSLLETLGGTLWVQNFFYLY